MSLPAYKPALPIIYTALIASSLLWAGTSIVAKVTLEQFPLFATLFIRFCIASLGLLPLFLLDRQRQKLTLKSLFQLALLGTLGTSLNIGLFFAGVARASILDTSVIIALSPVMLAMAGWLFLKERSDWHNVLGIFLAGFGAMLALTLLAPSQARDWYGLGLLFLSNVSMVAYTIYSKELIKQFSAVTIASVSFFVAMITFAPLAAWEYFSDPSQFVMTSQVLAGLLYLGIASSVVAYVLFEWSLNWLPAVHVAALSYIQPLAGIWMGVILLGEQLYWTYALGGVIVIVGVVLALHDPRSHHKPAKEVLHTRHPHKRA